MQTKYSGGVPYGYEYEPVTRTLKIEVNESRILKEIFRLALEGNGPNLIANELNSKSDYGRHNKKWAANTIANLLSPSRLIFYRGFDSNGLLGDWEGIISENHYREILEKRIANKSVNTPLKPSQKEKYLLSGIGKLFCHYCHGPVKASVTGKSPVKMYYYYCTTRQSSGASTCMSAKLIPMGKVDNLVLLDLKSRLTGNSLGSIYFFIEKYIREEIDNILDISYSANKNLDNNFKYDLNSSLDEYSNRLKEIQEHRDNIKRIYYPKAIENETDQELIINNIDRIILSNNELIINYKYPIANNLSFSFEIKM